MNPYSYLKKDNIIHVYMNDKPPLKNKDSIHDPNDRPFWYNYGRLREESFVNFCNSIDYPMKINPEKSKDTLALDLLYENNKAELKVLETPFFTSYKYGIPPEYCFTFGSTPYDRYSELEDFYIFIFFNPIYCISKYGEVNTDAYGVYREKKSDLFSIIKEKGKPHIHETRGGYGNDTSNYLIDIRKLTKVISLDHYLPNNRSLKLATI